jgi:hypothetical protein
MANYWYINISTENKSIIPKTTMDFIISNWERVSVEKKLPSENSTNVYLTIKCWDIFSLCLEKIAQNFVDDLAKTSDGIKISLFKEKVSSESTFSIYISKNGKWEHVDDIISESEFSEKYEPCYDDNCYGKKHTAFLKKVSKSNKDKLLLLHKKYLKSLKTINNKMSKLDKQKKLLHDKKCREDDIVLHINSLLNNIYMEEDG